MTISESEGIRNIPVFCQPRKKLASFFAHFDGLLSHYTGKLWCTEEILGYKKIQAKREEFRAKQSVLKKFRAAAVEINARSVKVAADMSRLRRAKEEITAKISALNTGGVPEFEAYKKNLLAVTASVEGVTPLPLDPVQRVVDNAEVQLAAMMAAYIEKLAANCPKDIKPGMVFRDNPTGRLYEVQSLPEQAKNKSLKDDAAIYLDGTWFKDDKPVGTERMNLAKLKKLKYLKTD